MKLSRKQRRRALILLPLSAAASILIFIILNLPDEPDETEIELYFRAVSAYEAGNLELAVRLTETLSKGTPSFFQARLLLAKALFFSDRWDEAAGILSRLLDDFENYTEAEIWLMRTSIQQGDLQAAGFRGENMLSRAPGDPRVLGMLARIAETENDYQRAIEYYSRAILFEEELAVNRIELAKIYSSLLNHDEAFKHLEKSLVLLSDDSPLRPGIISLLKNYKGGEPK
ncbi:MAG: tetratricopeptide repeat protein [Spirochaetales bacterium]|nr:tetratricopeptide repeat protein [Spirochaetales bacterium]